MDAAAQVARASTQQHIATRAIAIAVRSRSGLAVTALENRRVQ
jgi:hypothetical protein